jgi:hypothetical protein
MALILSGDTGVPASGMPTGSVIQTVNATTGTTVSSTTTTYVDTTLTATITPTSATSKILVIVHQNGVMKNGSATGEDMKLKIVRNGTDICPISLYSFYTGTNLQIRGQTLSSTYLDSPATTSAVVYKTQFANAEGTGTVVVQNEANNSLSTITLLEIKQ